MRNKKNEQKLRFYYIILIMFISKTSKNAPMKRAFLLLNELEKQKIPKKIKQKKNLKLYVYIYCHLHCCEIFFFQNQKKTHTHTLTK